MDIVAGTSAGGINGICLTRALDGDYSQEAIRDFWITEGDFGKLLDPKVRKLLEAVRAESGGLHGIAPPLDKLLGPRSGAPVLVRPESASASGSGASARRAACETPVIAFVKHPPRSALHGDLMCSLTWGALNDMQTRTSGPRAAPFLFADSGIDLAVTSTEFAGHYDAVPLSQRAGLRRGPPPRVPHPRRRAEARSTRTSGCSRSPRARRRRSRARSRRSASTTSDSRSRARARADWDDIAAPLSAPVPRRRRGASTAGSSTAASSTTCRSTRRSPPSGGARAASRCAARWCTSSRHRRSSPRRRCLSTLRDLDVPEANVLMETFRSVSTIPLSQTMGDQIARVRERNDRVLALRSVIEQRFDAVAERVDEIARRGGGRRPEPAGRPGGRRPQAGGTPSARRPTRAPT